jgi:hypothetical protein
MNLGLGNLSACPAQAGREKDDSHKDAKGEAKPAGSEQLAAGSNSDYGLQDSKQ